MQVDIQAAISVDGFVATLDGGTDWVRDLELYEKLCREYGCIVMGRTTYDEYGGPAFEDVKQIVLSTTIQDSKHPNVHFAKTAEQAVEVAKELGFDRLLVIGGGRTNGSFVTSGLVNKIMLDIHHVLLGQGKKLFGSLELDFKLELLSTKQETDFLTVEYRVISGLNLNIKT